jgi:hypothetical protein
MIMVTGTAIIVTMTAGRTAPGTATSASTTRTSRPGPPAEADSHSSGTWRLHGLTVESCLPLPGLEPGVGAADVRIVWGTVPDSLTNPVTQGGLFQASPGLFLMRVPGLVAFLVTDGGQILVDAKPSAKLSEILTFLLGAPIAAVLHQRGTLVLHGSAVSGPSGAVALLGHSGGGKSTITAALARRGFQVLTDDVVALTIEHNRILVQPGVPQVRLWQDTLKRLEIQQEHLEHTRTGLKKFVLPLACSRPRLAVPLTSMWFLDVTETPDLDVEVVEGSNAFHVVRELTRTAHAILGLGVQVSHFQNASAVASRVPLRRVRRPRGLDTINGIVAHIEESLR